jgi:hypothetical protein
MTKEIVSSGEHAIDVPLYIVRSRNATALRQSGKRYRCTALPLCNGHELRTQEDAGTITSWIACWSNGRNCHALLESDRRMKIEIDRRKRMEHAE